MANLEALLKLKQARTEDQYSANQIGGDDLLSMLARVAQNGHADTDAGNALFGMGKAYQQNQLMAGRSNFMQGLQQIAQSQASPEEKINALVGLKAQHGQDYGFGIDDIVKQFVDLNNQNVTMRGQDMTAENNRRDAQAKGWQPQTKEEAIEVESAKAGMKPPSQAMETTALYASRIKQANGVFDQLEQFINSQGAREYVQAGLPGWANFAKSGNMQSYQQAQRNFLNAVLRRESGAVISPSEFAEGRQQYFPQPGDKPAVLAQKKANRDLVMQNFIKASGRAYEPYGETETQPGSNGGGVPQIGSMFNGQKVKSVRLVKK